MFEYNHDQLAEVLSVAYPGRSHGVHFTVVQEITPDGDQDSLPWIAAWGGDDLPDAVQVGQLVAAHLPQAKHNIAERGVRGRIAQIILELPVTAFERDLTEVEVSAIKAALRDIPNQPGYPFDVEWPI
ncbi:hypothetical protein [Bordetella bronchiseptica]|uniref:hypothetical protein n=1 Tax=Bordetella bronchiseptica TaxID=518 RepID=UPI0005284B0E|nr:hypothetical protein [Bordetella bronchiseptica]